jgi:hypothetical protein
MFKKSNRPHLVKNRKGSGLRQADLCRFADCQKKPASVYGLCLDHRNQIAGGFERFYIAAQNIVEDLSICAIRVLPEAQIDSQFLQHCDRFLEKAVLSWSMEREAFLNVQDGKSKRSTKENGVK